MQFIRLNNFLVHYKWVDRRKDKTFVFINSLGTDFRIWEEVVKRIEPHGNVLLFDKRGHGLSDVAENTKELNNFTDDVVALLSHLNISKIVPVGLSVGGMIAQLLASRFPEKIERLVLCDTRHVIGNAQTWNERIAAVKGKGLSAISDSVMLRWFSEMFRSENAAQVAGYKNMLERTPTVGYIKTCEAIRDADLTEVARQLKHKTLCVAGSEDKSTTPEEVQSLAALIDGSRFEIINGSGHIPCVDNSEVLSNLIIDFINE
jgi:3-oxoadipate enol-lactonase